MNTRLVSRLADVFKVVNCSVRIYVRVTSENYVRLEYTMKTNMNGSSYDQRRTITKSMIVNDPMY